MTATLETPSARADRAFPRRGSRIGAGLGATALVIGAAGNTAQAVLGQVLGDQPDAVDAQIALANEHSVLLTTMCLVGLISVPFMAVGFLAAAQELGRHARRTAIAAGALLTLGMWGFLGIQIGMLMHVRALLADDGRAAADFLARMGEDSLIGVLFGLPFFVGCVLGVLTLTIGLLIKGGVPRWVPGIWLVFIVWDFTVGRVGPVDPHWLYLGGAVGLAAHLLGGRSDVRAGG